MWRDVVFVAAMLAAIVVLAAVVGPPDLDLPPSPSTIRADPRPDWYLLWYFAVLSLIPPRVEDYVILGAPLAIGVVLLVVPFLSNKGERSPARRPWAVAAVVLSVTMVGALWIEGYRSPW